MIAYASNTQGHRNLSALRSFAWRILLTPGQHRNPPLGFPYAIDNGQWRNFLHKLPFDAEGYAELVKQRGANADFIIIPDKVAEGKESLEFSCSWIDRLKHFRLILLAVQDGMDVKDVGAVLERHSNMGIFLGGSTEWKLRTMYGWGMVANAMRRYYHVGRVNSKRRIRLCMEAGANSFDGTSATMYSVTVPKLDAARRQAHLLTPANGAENISVAET